MARSCCPRVLDEPSAAAELEQPFGNPQPSQYSDRPTAHQERKALHPILSYGHSLPPKDYASPPASPFQELFGALIALTAGRNRANATSVQ